MESIELGNSGLKVLKPSIEFFVEKILAKKRFAFMKLNHGFWQMVNKEEPVSAFCRSIHGAKFCNDCIDLLGRLPRHEDFMIGVSHLGPPDENVRVGDADASLRAIQERLPDRTLYYGPLWKTFAIDNSMKKFVRAIRDRKVVIVGLEHLKPLGEIWGLKNYTFMKIGIDATVHRYLIEMHLIQMGDPETIFLFQAGEMLSMCLIQNMWGHTTSTLIDCGRSLDIWLKSCYITAEDHQRYLELAAENEESTKFGLFVDIKDQPWFQYKRKYLL